MFPPAPDKAATSDAKRVRRQLARSGKNWPRDPLLHDLSPNTVYALQYYIGEQEGAHAWIGIYPVLFFAAISLFDTKIGIALSATMLLLASITYCLVKASPCVEARYAVYALTQTNSLSVLPTLIKTTRYEWGRHVLRADAITKRNRLFQNNSR